MEQFGLTRLCVEQGNETAVLHGLQISRMPRAFIFPSRFYPLLHVSPDLRLRLGPGDLIFGISLPPIKEETFTSPEIELFIEKTNRKI